MDLDDISLQNIIIVIATELPRESEVEGWWEDLTEDCRLMNFETWHGKVSNIVHA